MSASHHNAPMSPQLSCAQFLSMVARTLDSLQEIAQNRYFAVADLVRNVNLEVLKYLEDILRSATTLSLPVSLSRDDIAKLQQTCSAIEFRKSKSNLPEYALAHLLHHLRRHNLITCPMPRIRLDTERDLAASFHPDQVPFWSRTEIWWKAILEETLKTGLPQSRGDQDKLRQTLIEAGYVALLGLILEGDLFISHQIAPLTRLRVSDLDVEHGFLQIRVIPRRYRTRSEQHEEKTPPEYLTEPFWLPPTAQLLLFRYIRMRLLWGKKLGVPLVLTNPRSYLFHDSIRAEPNQLLEEWIKKYPTTFRPHRITAALAPSMNGVRSKRTVLGEIIDARRAHRITTIGPIFTALRSRRIMTRPPTIDSWGRVILGKQPQQISQLETPDEPSSPVSNPTPTATLTDSTNHCPPSAIAQCQEHEAVLDACRSELELLHRQVAPLLRSLRKTTSMSERVTMAQTIENLTHGLPRLGTTEECSPEAPRSNFRVQLEWLIKMLTTHYPGHEALAPISVRSYYLTVQTRLVDALGARSILTLTHRDDVSEVVGDMLDGDLEGETLRTQRTHFVHLFRFLHREYRTLGYDIAEVDLSNEELWVGAEVHPFSLLAPQEVDAFINQLSLPDKVASILGSYGMARRGELAHLRLADLVGSDEDLYLSIWTSKTRSGIRRVPLWALVPTDHIRTLLAYRTSRAGQVASNGTAPLLVNEQGNPFTELELGTRIAQRMKKARLRVTSLHPLRHQGASWFPLVWYRAFHEISPNTLGFDFRHPLFEPDHLIRFRQLFLPFDRRLERASPYETNPFHVLSRILGHSNPIMSIRCYVHSLSFLEYLLMQDRDHVPDLFKNISRAQAARLVVSAPSEITRTYGPSGNCGEDNVDESVPLSDILDELRSKIGKRRSQRRRA